MRQETAAAGRRDDCGAVGERGMRLRRHHGPRIKLGARPSRSSVLVAVVGPALGVMVSIAVVAWFARQMLARGEAQEVDIDGLLPLFLVLLALAAIATILVFLQSSRSARRLIGPVHRINVAMQRIRQGDIAHRVHLRKNDELGQVAAELNKLLDWLNENPPAGAQTGGDVVEMDLDGHFHDAHMVVDEDCPAIADQPAGVWRPPDQTAVRQGE